MAHAPKLSPFLHSGNIEDLLMLHAGLSRLISYSGSNTTLVNQRSHAKLLLNSLEVYIKSGKKEILHEFMRRDLRTFFKDETTSQLKRATKLTEETIAMSATTIFKEIAGRADLDSFDETVIRENVKAKLAPMLEESIASSTATTPIHRDSRSSPASPLRDARGQKLRSISTFDLTATT